MSNSVRVRLGSKKNPCEDNIDVGIAMSFRSYCTLYVTNDFTISEDNLLEANVRHIKFKVKGED